jgi:MFS family permease
VPGTFTALRIRNFRLYIIGMVIAYTGTWMLRIAQGFLVLGLTDNSPIALGITTALMYLPLVLVGSWSGVLADRYPKRAVLMWTASLMGLTALALGLLDVSGHAQLWQVYVLVFAYGVVSAIDQPTRLSFVVEMVGPDSLANAVGLNSAQANLTRLVGPALAGVLIAGFGTGPVILVYCVSILAVIGALLLMRPVDLHEVPRLARAKGQFREGIRYVMGSRDMRAVFLTIAILGSLAMTQETLLPLYATHIFGGDAQLYGWLAAALAVGSFGGALLAARRPRPTITFFSFFALLYGLVAIVTALMPTVWAMVVALPVMGITQITCITAANANVQLSVSPQVRGRVMALYMTCLLGAAPVGAVLAGWIADVTSARTAMVASGLAAVVAAALGRLVYLRTAPTADDLAAEEAARRAQEEARHHGTGPEPGDQPVDTLRGAAQVEQEELRELLEAPLSEAPVVEAALAEVPLIERARADDGSAPGRGGTDSR